MEQGLEKVVSGKREGPDVEGSSGEEAGEEKKVVEGQEPIKQNMRENSYANLFLCK